jgi:uncharacterized protein (TIGR02757 family)
MMDEKLVAFLNEKVANYNRPEFIAADPICIPHRFIKQPDIEIAAFFAAIFAWGNRKTIINKTSELMALMNNAPYDFCMNHTDADLKKLLQFKHRTFNATDLLYFVQFFHMHYSRYASLETAFTLWMKKGDENIENALNGFYKYFFSLPDVPSRTLKHMACPRNKSACKRMNMFLRWMVRKDKCGVDFGAWKNISPAQLIIPLDVHVARVARHFNLLTRPQTDWQAALELTQQMKQLNKKDPASYDIALFSLGVLEKY